MKNPVFQSIKKKKVITI